MRVYEKMFQECKLVESGVSRKQTSLYLSVIVAQPSDIFLHMLTGFKQFPTSNNCFLSNFTRL